MKLPHIRPKKPKSPIPRPLPPPSKSDLETSYYQHQAYIALHSAGVHVHFNRDNESL